LISIYFAHWQQSTVSDECAIYFLNFVLDTTLGVLISYALLLMVQNLAVSKRVGKVRVRGTGDDQVFCSPPQAAIGENCATMLRSGYYGEVPSLT